MPVPTTTDWLKISDQFEELQNMPDAVGAFDRKHIRIDLFNCTTITKAFSG